MSKETEQSDDRRSFTRIDVAFAAQEFSRMTGERIARLRIWERGASPAPERPSREVPDLQGVSPEARPPGGRPRDT